MRRVFILGLLIAVALILIDGSVAPAQSPTVGHQVYTQCEQYYILFGDEIIVVECCIVEDYDSMTCYQECREVSEPWQSQ